MGGRRIDDHSFWAGRSSKDSTLPEGVHVKQVADVEGAGDLKRYEDTEETIRSQQEMGIREAEKRPLKPNHRN